MTAILFDLDGTLIDTAPGLALVLNQLRAEEQLSALPYETIRPIAGLGAAAMIKQTFNMKDENDAQIKQMREDFLKKYDECIANSKPNQFFHGIAEVLNHLQEKKIPWGIVTNKLTRHTQMIVQSWEKKFNPDCVVCGDTLDTYKPSPEPILYACTMLQKKPQECIYIGDAETDVIASKAAGTKSLVAMYGYISETEHPLSWQADGYITEPKQIMDWLSEHYL